MCSRKISAFIGHFIAEPEGHGKNWGKSPGLRHVDSGGLHWGKHEVKCHCRGTRSTGEGLIIDFLLKATKDGGSNGGKQYPNNYIYTPVEYIIILGNVSSYLGPIKILRFPYFTTQQK